MGVLRPGASVPGPLCDKAGGWKVREGNTTEEKGRSTQTSQNPLSSQGRVDSDKA